jgi:hypothetical protein
MSLRDRIHVVKSIVQTLLRGSYARTLDHTLHVSFLASARKAPIAATARAKRKSKPRELMRCEYEYGLWLRSTTSHRYVSEVAVKNLGLKWRGTSTYTAIAQPDESV